MDRQLKRKLLATIPTCIIGWTFSYLATIVFGDYAFGLFIWLPFVMGAMTTIILGHKNEVKKSFLRSLSFATLAIFCIGLLAFAFEGVICVVMALPIGIFFNWLGHLVGYEIIKKKLITNVPTTLSILILSVPALMGFETITDNKVDVANPIITSIEINAPIEIVWKNVIEFPELPEPTEFIFKTGIAYPINATIFGKGVGAVRHCNFTTGSFVEPITEWNEPNLLRFDVAEQPEPMKELSFYDLHPNHLHGYFVSKKGQFKLTKLTNEKTLLEGTTWYYNKIKPTFYWNLWSDNIIHKIHDRVLTHIKNVSEKTKTINASP